jgi:hypothetical protein
MRTRLTAVIASLCVAFGIASAGEGKMVFLTVVQKSQSLRVIEARIVDGTPRGRFNSRPAFALYEQHTSAGRVLESGQVPMPPPLTFDVPDSSGKLSGGVVHRDSVVFSFRVPYRSNAATLHFFSLEPTADKAGGLGKAGVKGGEIGSFDLVKALSKEVK